MDEGVEVEVIVATTTSVIHIKLLPLFSKYPHYLPIYLLEPSEVCIKPGNLRANKKMGLRLLGLGWLVLFIQWKQIIENFYIIII